MASGMLLTLRRWQDEFLEQTNKAFEDEMLSEKEYKMRMAVLRCNYEILDNIYDRGDYSE